MLDDDRDFEDTPAWNAVAIAVDKLINRHDIVLISSREHVIGVIVRALSGVGLGSLTLKEYEGMVGAFGEACVGAYAIEDWECPALTGLTKPELKEVLSKLTGTIADQDTDGDTEDG